MRFQLAKTLEGIRMYGPIPDLGSGWPDKVEEYYVDDKDDWFLDHMAERINAACGTLLDDGDVDFINAESCAELMNMLHQLPDQFIPPDFSEPIAVLKNFAERAIAYGTGISIEM